MKQPVNIWIDAREFQKKGGWKLDTQFTHEMGGGYLIAADIPGVPVEDAAVTVQIPEKGTYRIWVRDRNWYRPHDPGIFALLVNGSDNGKVLGAMPSDAWVWEIAGDFSLEAGENTVALHDLTGYFGRCASVLITNDFDYTPPREIERLHKARAKCKGLDILETFGGDYDVIVAGGGPGGVPAALACARKGIKTLLLHDRPVLGGNGSSEIGITFEGASSHFAYGREGGIAEELRRLRDQKPGFHGDWTAALEALTEQQENLTVLCNRRVCDVQMESDTRISGVTAQDMLDFGKTRFTAKVFIDCTGDGWLGYYAGAKYRIGREAQYQHSETLAPEMADTQTMSGCIRADHIPFMVKKKVPSEYHAPDWVPKLPSNAADFGRTIDLPGTRMAWWLEAPNTYDDMYDGEVSRDALFLVLLGYYEYLKNHWQEHGTARYLQMQFSGIMLGRRESRRFIGDYILTQDDCTEGASFPDAVSYSGWHIDIHHPEGIYSGRKGGLYCSVRANMPSVPFRCLYSVNIENLMFAGRNISATHIAMGTTRVQNTIATLGQAVGTAAAMCVKLQKDPGKICKDHIKELQQQLLKDDQYIPGIQNEDPRDICLRATAGASSTCTEEEFTTRRGIPGALMPLDRARLVSLSVSRRNGDVERFYVKLHSACPEEKKVTVHAKVVGSNVDVYSGEENAVLSAEITVPPMGEHWVEVPIHLTVKEDLYVENCIIYVWIDPAEGISWRQLDGMNMYYRYAELLPEGQWSIKSGKSFLIQREEPKTVMANCGPENVNNGYNRIVDENRYEWVSDPKEPLPQWVALTFEKPEAVGEVQLTFDTDLANPLVSWSGKNPTPKQCVKNYCVQLFDGTGWVTVVRVKDNFMRRRTHSFPLVTAQKLRVTVTETWGDLSVRIMEIRAGSGKENAYA